MAKISILVFSRAPRRLGGKLVPQGCAHGGAALALTKTHTKPHNYGMKIIDTAALDTLAPLADDEGDEVAIGGERHGHPHPAGACRDAGRHDRRIENREARAVEVEETPGLVEVARRGVIAEGGVPEVDRAEGGVGQGATGDDRRHAVDEQFEAQDQRVDARPDRLEDGAVRTAGILLDQPAEDALCLVFVETQLADFAQQHDDAKVVDILVKSLRKMSDRGREAAASLSLSDAERGLVARAVAALGSG